MTAMVLDALAPVRRTADAVARAALDPLPYLRDPGRPATGRPHVGLVGFYGWGNYGDELFGTAFAQHLGPAMDLEPMILSDAEAARRPSLRRRVQATDAILVGGGDLVVSWARTRYWRRVFLLRPVFLAGLGVPTWRKPTREGLGILRGFVRHPNVRSIGARDEASARWIREQLEPSAPVRVAPDLVCGVDLPPASRPDGPPIFGVAVRRRETPDDLRHVRRLCDRATELGYRVRRIVLATGPTRQADLEATAGLGLEDTELISSDDLEAISRAIGECSVLASMKFHGVVVATLYGVPALGLMPTAKTRRFLEDVGRPELVSAHDAEDLPDRLTRDLAPIDPATIDRLRAGAGAELATLRSEILATTAAGYGRAAAGGSGSTGGVSDRAG
jgi:polysaccharide pyruvyl transferase